MVEQGIGPIFVKGVFDLISSIFSSRNNRYNERIAQMVEENNRLINEINAHRKEREDREIEEKNVKNKKIENDEQTFKLCLEETQKKLKEIQIIQEGHDDYEILK